MAWLKRGYKMVDAETAIRCFADHKCNACQCEIKYLEKHPDAKAIIIGGSHIALTGYYRRVWRFFWEVKEKVKPKKLCPVCDAEISLTLINCEDGSGWDEGYACPECGELIFEKAPVREEAK